MNKEYKKDWNYMIALLIIAHVVAIIGLAATIILIFCLFYLKSAAYIVFLSCLFLNWLIPEEYWNQMHNEVSVVQKLAPFCLISFILNFVVSFFIGFCANRINYSLKFRWFYSRYIALNFIPFVQILLIIFVWVDFIRVKKQEANTGANSEVGYRSV